MNTATVLINGYALTQLLGAKPTFDLVESKQDSPYLKLFLAFHHEDLVRFFPTFALERVPTDSRVYWILRDAMPAGVVIASVQDQDTIFLHLDYVIAGYRDLRPARYFHDKLAERPDTPGSTRILTEAGPRQHQKYLRALGFRPVVAAAGVPLFERDSRSRV